MQNRKKDTTEVCFCLFVLHSQKEEKHSRRKRKRTKKTGAALFVVVHVAFFSFLTAPTFSFFPSLSPLKNHAFFHRRAPFFLFLSLLLYLR